MLLELPPEFLILLCALNCLLTAGFQHLFFSLPDFLINFIGWFPGPIVRFQGIQSDRTKGSFNSSLNLHFRDDGEILIDVREFVCLQKMIRLSFAQPKREQPLTQSSSKVGILRFRQKWLQISDVFPSSDIWGLSLMAKRIETTRRFSDFVSVSRKISEVWLTSTAALINLLFRRLKSA